MFESLETWHNINILNKYTVNNLRTKKTVKLNTKLYSVLNPQYTACLNTDKRSSTLNCGVWSTRVTWCAAQWWRSSSKCSMPCVSQYTTNNFKGIEEIRTNSARLVICKQIDKTYWPLCWVGVGKERLSECVLFTF